MFYVTVFVLAITTCIANGLNEDVLKTLNNALIQVNASIDSIYKEWQVDKYPNFLKSCFMHRLK